MGGGGGAKNLIGFRGGTYTSDRFFMKWIGFFSHLTFSVGDLTPF